MSETTAEADARRPPSSPPHGRRSCCCRRGSGSARCCGSEPYDHRERCVARRPGAAARRYPRSHGCASCGSSAGADAGRARVLRASPPACPPPGSNVVVPRLRPGRRALRRIALAAGRGLGRSSLPRRRSPAPGPAASGGGQDLRADSCRRVLCRLRGRRARCHPPGTPSTSTHHRGWLPRSPRSLSRARPRAGNSRGDDPRSRRNPGRTSFHVPAAIAEQPPARTRPRCSPRDAPRRRMEPRFQRDARVPRRDVLVALECVLAAPAR